MRILLLGAQGQIGRELLPVLRQLGEVVAPGRGELDLCDAVALRGHMMSTRPDVVVNAAAHTAVDRAETERALAFRINAEAVGEMATYAAELGAVLVHYSTDYVFDGRASRPFTEDDPVAPLNCYGETKLEGERRVCNSGARHLIFRTSWIYAQHGTNFLLTMLRLAAERETLRVVNDQTGAPTWARQVAHATGEALIQCLRDPAGYDWSGLYHLSAGGATTWYEFARVILRTRNGGELPARPTLMPIATSDYPSAARRPACSLLDNGKLRRRFGIQLDDWETALRQCMALLIA